MTPSRPLGMYSESYLIMWALMLVTFAIFGKGVYDRYRLWKVGAPEKRPESWSQGIGRFINNSLLHLRILRETVPGLMHLLLFSAFAVCALGTLSVAITEDLNIPLFYGWYYLILSLAMDILGFAALMGIGIVFALTIGRVDAPAIIAAAVVGFVLAIPVSWFVAKQIAG